MLLIHCLKSFRIWSFFWSTFSHIRTEYGEIMEYALRYFFFQIISIRKARTMRGSVLQMNNE